MDEDGSGNENWREREIVQMNKVLIITYGVIVGLLVMLGWYVYLDLASIVSYIALAGCCFMAVLIGKEILKKMKG